MRINLSGKNTIILGLMVIASAIQSCKSHDDAKSSEVYVNNFDNYLFYGFNHYSLNTDQSYSGKYSCITDKDRNFGMGMKIESKDLLKIAPVKLRISGMVFCEDPKSATSLVVSIDEGSTNLYWYGVDLTKNVKKANEWTSISGEFECPESLPPGSVLSFYLWNTGGKRVYIDDQTIEFIQK